MKVKSINDRATDFKMKFFDKDNVNTESRARLLLIENSYINGATDQRDIDIQRACEILRKTGYFKNDEGISEAAMEEQFIQCMKGE